jgi:hypothetical protein
MSTKYDTEALTATFNKNGTEHTISCLGLPSSVVARLVLVGAVHLISKRKDPMEAWDIIRKGGFKRVRRKNLPKTVLAYAALKDVEVHEVWKHWQTLTQEERKELRRNKEIRKMVIELDV